MADETKTTESRPLETIPVTVIGTDAASKLPSGVVAETPEPHQPNFTMVVVSPVVAILIRFANAYFTTLFGLVGAGLTSPQAIPAQDFYHLVLKCAGLSIAGAGFGLLKDVVTVFGRLEKKYPLQTGNV